MEHEGVKVLPVYALGCVTKGFDIWIYKLEMMASLPLTPKTALLGTAPVLKNFLGY